MSEEQKPDVTISVRERDSCSPRVWLQRCAYRDAWEIHLTSHLLGRNMIGVARPADMIFDVVAEGGLRREPWLTLCTHDLLSFHDWMTRELQRCGVLPPQPTEIERTMLKESLKDAREVRDKLLSDQPAKPRGLNTVFGQDQVCFGYPSQNGSMDVQFLAQFVSYLGYRLVEEKRRDAWTYSVTAVIIKPGDEDAPTP